MATLDSIYRGQSVIKVIKLTTVSNGDTYVLDSNTATGIKAYWTENISTSAKITATLSSDTFSFANDSSAATVLLFILL